MYSSLTNTSKWFSLFFSTYIFLYVMNKLGYIFPAPIQFYLADLLAVPVIATLSMWFTRWATQKRDFILPGWQVIFTVLLLTVLFEILLPLKMNRYTADPVDVLMYSLGGMFYWKVMNTPASRKYM